MNYTDTQLKQALAKMLPETIFCDMEPDDESAQTASFSGLRWYHGKDYYDSVEILDTELLHLCWLVEENLTDDEKMKYYWDKNGELSMSVHTSWNDRTERLSKVKGIEIV
jgi:hypothetical protein